MTDSTKIGWSHRIVVGYCFKVSFPTGFQCNLFKMKVSEFGMQFIRSYEIKRRANILSHY